MRSLKEPGSPSAAFTTTVAGAMAERLAMTVRHLRPVGNPAPPRPRSPDASTSSTIADGIELAGHVEALAAARPLVRGQVGHHRAEHALDRLLAVAHRPTARSSWALFIFDRPLTPFWRASL